MTLKSIVEQIKEVNVLANENVEEGAIETLNARRGRKARAIESLKQLKRQYREELLRGAAFIVLTGSAKNAFSTIATESFECFSANADAFYEDLASRVPEALYLGKESVSNVFDVLGRHLEDKAMEIGVSGYPMLRFKSEYARKISSKEDFVTLIKQGVNEQVGGEMVGINTVAMLSDSAAEKGHVSAITPIILTSDDEKLLVDIVPALRRLTYKTFLVVAGKPSKALKGADAITVKDVSTESVDATLSSIRKLLRK